MYIRTITSVYWSVGWFDVSKWFYWSMWRDTVALLVIVLIESFVRSVWRTGVDCLKADRRWYSL